MDGPEFDRATQSVTVPMAYFMKLVRCFHGDGPREFERPEPAPRLSDAVEEVGSPDPPPPPPLRTLQLARGTPEDQGFVPKGRAAAKAKARDAEVTDGG